MGCSWAGACYEAHEVSSSAPEVSIVIPVYNEEALLRSALGELRARLLLMHWQYEIILAENGSTDRTLERLRELENSMG